MNVMLSLQQGDVEQTEFVLHRLPFVIGRSPDADLTLEDRWVSRLHCEIDLDHGNLIIRDLKSKHGTLVNGEPVSEAMLLPGDVLRIGLSSLIARYEFGELREDQFESAWRV